MYLHYLKVAIRNLAKQKVLSFINVFGLSVGLACFSLFLLYTVNEFSYDRNHKNAAAIYRVYNWWKFTGKEKREGAEPSSTTPLGPAMKRDLPDVENYVRIQHPWGEQLVKIDNKIQSVKMTFADPQVFSVFTFPLLAGNAATALQDPHNIVITKEKALQLFGQINVIGKSIALKNGESYEPFVISAVAENIPENSTVRFDLLGSFDHVLQTEDGKASMANWNMTIGIDNYVLLRPGSTLPNEAAKLIAFRQKYFPEEKAPKAKKGANKDVGTVSSGYGLQPLRDIHTGIKIDPYSSVDPKDIWILIGIAAAVLLIACINFTTLAIGRSAGRAKEVGVRKVMGSQRKQLVNQFLAESLLLSILSAALGLLLAVISLPFFNQLAGRNLHFSFSQFPEMTWLLAGLVVLVGLLSGSYPALVLSGFKPVEVLKNKVRLAGSNIFTKSLVTFQFVLSIGLIIATAIILQQLSYMHSKNLGFNKENVVMINVPGSDSKKIYPLFRQALQANTHIKGITESGIGLGANEGQMGGGYEINGKVTGVIEYPIDADYLNVMGVQLIAGRNFDPAITSDTVNSVIVNEALVKNDLGITPQEAIGKELKSPRDNSFRTIIGVTRDFHFEALKRQVRSQLFFMNPQFESSRYFIRIAPGNPSASLAAIGAAWKKTVPDLPFQYSFVDEKFNSFYKAEERWSSIVGWAGGISIFLACLGLFGLAALAAVNRTKEIGIRKVLGASAGVIVRLLSKDFLKLVIIALLIASPIAWYFMNQWLQDYAYRIDIGWYVFAITGALAVLISLATISFQAVRAAMANPVKSLRSE